MDEKIKEKFIRNWAKYFKGASLPIVFYYTDTEPASGKVKPPADHRCVVADLARVRTGRGLYLDVASIGCTGGKKYLGFSDQLMPNFEYFLSYGIPGQLEGERYKKSPAMVKEVLKAMPKFKAPAKFIVFKRWDKIDAQDEPAVVIFFDRPDVISGLFTLANFDESEQNGVFSPFAAGCATIITYPYLEKGSSRPRGVLGMFDVSARPCVPADTFTFAVPISKFKRMIENMDESFLITGSWGKVKRRIAKTGKTG
jgi:uncharacterized protein (DUF169 family)